MNTISYPQKGDPGNENRDPGNGRNSEEEIQESIYPYHHELNITDGGEFLDDALRMKEQPLEETTVKKNE